jgi:SPP1 family predicted phage head-tail adaptor
MKAGQLRHPISFISDDIVSQDDSGGIVRSPRIHARAWAEVTELSGTELVQAQQKKPNSTHQVRTRFVANVDSTMKIRHQARILNIEGIEDIGDRHIELVILCREEG